MWIWDWTETEYSYLINLTRPILLPNLFSHVVESEFIQFFKGIFVVQSAGAVEYSDCLSAEM